MQRVVKSHLRNVNIIVIAGWQIKFSNFHFRNDHPRETRRRACKIPNSPSREGNRINSRRGFYIIVSREVQEGTQRTASVLYN